MFHSDNNIGICCESIMLLSVIANVNPKVSWIRIQNIIVSLLSGYGICFAVSGIGNKVSLAISETWHEHEILAIRMKEVKQ